MLATIEKSLVALFNPAAARAAGPSTKFRRHVGNGLALLRRITDELSLPVVTIASGKLAAESEPIGKTIVADPFTLFSSDAISPELDRADGRYLYLGGLWLDEDILVAALTAQTAGFDTRVLIDLSVARRPDDRSPTLTRLNQHGVLLATTRQAAYEWAMAAGPSQRQTLRRLVDAAAAD